VMFGEEKFGRNELVLLPLSLHSLLLRHLA
jgi:hypothetical protein